MKYNTFFLSASDKTTGSTYTVTGEKGGSVIRDDGMEVNVDGTAESTNSDNSSSSETDTTDSSDIQANTNTEVAVPNDNVPSQSTGFFGGGTMTIIIIYALFIGAFYYFVLRPQKKRQNEAKEMLEALKVGDDVLTSSGQYGKITDIGPEICVIEFGTNKGIRIPVRKSEIVKIETPNI